MAVHYVEYIGDVKNSVDMREVVTRYGFTPDRSGYICCPFHTEKTASLKVWNDHYKCFGCGAHGDVISFVQNFLHVDFQTAMETINREYELHLPFQKELSLREMRAARQARNRIRRAQSEAERKQAQLSALTCMWAECDRIIISHPVPDNEETAEAYRMRDYTGYLLDNYRENGEILDELFN